MLYQGKARNATRDEYPIDGPAWLYAVLHAALLVAMVWAGN